jgi:5,10-methylenetetrahydrofolate reductase
MVHVPWARMSVAEVHEALSAIKHAGIRNILALHGDGKPAAPVAAQASFTSTADLVAFTKKEFDGYFCIGVCGYPQGLPMHGVRYCLIARTVGCMDYQ